MRILGAEPLASKSNYFLGNDPRTWFTNVPNYRKVRYQGAYPGVDLVYYAQQGQVEYDFVVSPGFDPGAIEFEITTETLSATPAARAQRRHPAVRIDAAGDLRVSVEGREICLRKPTVYQPRADSITDMAYADHRCVVDGRYLLLGEGHVGFRVGRYDTSRRLIIDPLLSYSTYLGGSGQDFATAIAVDAAGNAYVTGYTLAANFPVTTGVTQGAIGGGSSYGDAFVAKLNAAGSGLVYSTYLGGSDDDLANAIGVDSAGNAYVVGYTRSVNFPTTFTALQKTAAGGTCGSASFTFPCGDGFVAKLDDAGNALAYSTYLGGSGDDWAFGIALDSATSAYVTGYSESGDFPTTLGAFEPNWSGATCGTEPCREAFVAKLDATGSALVYSTYLGGAGGQGYAIKVTDSGSAYVVGSTDSSNFPVTPGAFQASPGENGDAFVTQLKPDGSGLVYSTYLGGSGTDVGTALALDASGNAYVAGLTDSFGFPISPGAFQPSCTGCVHAFHDAFVTKLNASGSALSYSTFLGGSDEDLAYAIAVDTTGNAYVAGRTLSLDFPTVNPVQVACAGGCLKGFHDAFVVRLNSTGSVLVYSTYLGGSNNDAAYGIELDSAANAYVAGGTSSSDFLTSAGGFQTARAGAVDAFLAKIDPPDGPLASLSATSLSFPDQLVGTTSAAQIVVLQNAGNLPLTIASLGVTGDYAATHTCETSLEPGASCAISITFTPTSAGTRTGTITIAGDSLGGPQEVSLIGNGVASPAVAVVSPASLDFGDQGVGTDSAARLTTLTNTGGSLLVIQSIAVSGDFAQTNTCGASLAPGASCILTTTFSPEATGLRTGTLTIAHDASGSPLVVALSGTGTAAFALLTDRSSAVVVRGTDSVVFTLSASSLFGFLDPISLACSGQSPASCSFSYPSIRVGQNSTLSVSNLRAVTANSLSFELVGTSGQQISARSLSISLADFSLSASPAHLTVAAGHSATATLTATPLAGFVGSVSLACGGVPQSANCSVSPNLLVLSGSTTAEGMLTVKTRAPSVTSPWSPGPPADPFPIYRRLWGLPALATLALLALWVAARGRAGSGAGTAWGAKARVVELLRASPRLVVRLALAHSLLANFACHGGRSEPTLPASAGTPPGTYALTVTGTYRDGSSENAVTLAHSISVTLTVN